MVVDVSVVLEFHGDMMRDVRRNGTFMPSGPLLLRPVGRCVNEESIKSFLGSSQINARIKDLMQTRRRGFWEGYNGGGVQGSY